MAWWQWYLVLSFGISLVLTTCEAIYFYRKPEIPEFDKQADYDIEEAVKNGHIQKEVFGDRIVLFPKDDEGRFLLKVTESVKALPHKQKTLFFVIAVLYVAVVWPHELYLHARYYFSSAG